MDKGRGWGRLFCEEKGEKILGQIGSRLTASRSFIKGFSLYAYPAWGYFSVKKSNQKSLGEAPETPDASVRPDRKVYDLPDLGLDDAYKVDF